MGKPMGNIGYSPWGKTWGIRTPMGKTLGIFFNSSWVSPWGNPWGKPWERGFPPWGKTWGIWAPMGKTLGKPMGKTLGNFPMVSPMGKTLPSGFPPWGKPWGKPWGCEPEDLSRVFPMGKTRGICALQHGCKKKYFFSLSVPQKVKKDLKMAAFCPSGVWAAPQRLHPMPGAGGNHALSGYPHPPHATPFQYFNSIKSTMQCCS